MRDLRQWLEEQHDELESIAERCDTTAPLVHLAAVLVFEGFTDAVLEDQLTIVERRLAADEHRLLVGAQRALPEIRALLASTDIGGAPPPMPSVSPHRGRTPRPAAARHHKQKEHR